MSALGRRWGGVAWALVLAAAVAGARADEQEPESDPCASASASASASATVAGAPPGIDPRGAWSPIGTPVDKPTLTCTSASSLVARFAGGTSADGCAGVHRVLPLGRSYSCAEAVIRFDFDPLFREGVVEIDFCRGSRCDVGRYYGAINGALLAACVSPRPKYVTYGGLSRGANVVPTRKLQPEFDGSCDGAFDGIDVRVSSRFLDGRATMTLSNLRVDAERFVGPPAPKESDCPPNGHDDSVIGSVESGFYACGAQSHVELRPHGRVAVGIGSGLPPGSASRLNLDVAAELWTKLWPTNTRGETWTVFGASLATGFRTYPTYAALDVGLGWGQPLFFGAAVLVGPAARLDPTSGIGGQARFDLHVLALDVGVRAIFMANDRDGQIALTVGLGPFLLPGW